MTTTFESFRLDGNFSLSVFKFFSEIPNPRGRVWAREESKGICDQTFR